LEHFDTLKTAKGSHFSFSNNVLCSMQYIGYDIADYSYTV